MRRGKSRFLSKEATEQEIEDDAGDEGMRQVLRNAKGTPDFHLHDSRDASGKNSH